MYCKNCNVSCFEKPLTRTKPTGQDGEFMCHDCISALYPNKYKEIQNDNHTKVVQDIFDAINSIN